MKKVLLVSHVSGFIPQFEMNQVKMLKEWGYEVHYASNFHNPSYGDDNERLRGTGIICHQVDFVRSPWGRGNVRALRQLVKLMRSEEFAMVHCHNPMSGALTRVAARLTRTAPVLYTAHGFHFYKGAPFHMWAIYGTIEWLCSFLTSQQICINREDYRFARKHFRCRRVNYVPGVGIRPEEIRGKDLTPGQMLSKRRELGVPEDAVMLVSAGELIPRKNHETVMRAMGDLPGNVVYVICGHGELEDYLKELAESLGLSGRVIMAGYRQDLFDIYKAADICVFPSLQEGLPVALLEAMAIGLPAVCSDIRGSNELIDEGKGGFRVSPKDTAAYVDKIGRLIADGQLRRRMGAYNRKKAENYREEKTAAAMEKIYRHWLRIKDDRETD